MKYIEDGEWITGVTEAELVVDGQVVATNVTVMYTSASGDPKDKIRVVVKVGDQETAAGKEALGMKDGMVVDYHRSKDYWPEVGQHMCKVFSMVEVPDTPENLAKLQWACSVVEQDGEMVRQRTGKIPLAELENTLLMPGIEGAWRSTKSVPVCDGGVLDLNADIVTTDTKTPVVLDINAVSTGDFDVGGGAGDDYATWAAARADIANLTGNLTFTQTSAVTEVARTAVTENLNNHTLTYTSNNPPDGDPTAGWITSINADGNTFSEQQEGAGTTLYDGLYIKYILNQTGATGFWVTAAVGVGFTMQIRNCMLDGNGGFGYYGIFGNDADVTWEVFNTVIWDFDGSGFYGTINNNSIWENCTAYACGVQGFNPSNAASIIRNCAAYGNVAADFAFIGNATGNNNSSSDATAADANWAAGSGNITAQVAANDFLSTSDADSDFLDLVLTGALAKTGNTTILAANTTGIRGRTRPNSLGSVSIGAAEWYSTGPSTATVAALLKKEKYFKHFSPEYA